MAVTGADFSDSVRFTTNKERPVTVTVDVLNTLTLQDDYTHTEVDSVSITDIDDSSFTINAQCSGIGGCNLSFDYDADADIYRLEETKPGPI